LAVLSSPVGRAETALAELPNRQPMVIASHQFAQKSRRKCFKTIIFWPVSFLDLSCSGDKIIARNLTIDRARLLSVYFA
jgi:hypothetical protein